MVNLSERILGGIGCDPWLVFVTAGEHRPGNAGKLVGERDRQQVAMREAFAGPVDPGQQDACRGGGTPLEDDVGGLHEERAQVLVAALGDAAQLGAIAGRLLLRDEAEPAGVGKNTFHLVGLDKRGAIAMRIKVSRNQLVRRLVNLPPCLIGLEAGCGSHHIARQIVPLGHDVRLIPAQYVKPFLKGHKNDYRDAEAIAEAVQRPTMSFVAIKTPEQSDLLSLHRVRSRLVRQRTAIINQIRGFLIERGITVRQGPAPLRKALPDVLSSPPEALSPRMLRLIAELDEDWRRLDDRIEALSAEILNLSEKDPACHRLMTVPGIGPIILYGPAVRRKAER